MPQVLILVFHRRTMSGSTKKSARFIGIWIVSGCMERSKGRIGFIHAIPVNIKFGSRARILKIISSIMFGHPRTLDKRSVGQKHSGKGLLFICQLFGFSLFSFHFPHQLFCFLKADHRQRVVFSKSLIAVFFRMSLDEFHRLMKLMHGLRIKLRAPDRRNAVAAPVKIQLSVIIQEQVGIPEIKGAGNPLVRSVQHIFGAVEVADGASSGSGKIHIVTYHTHIRRIVIQGQVVRKPVAFPVHHIFGYPYT